MLVRGSHRPGSSCSLREQTGRRGRQHAADHALTTHQSRQPPDVMSESMGTSHLCGLESWGVREVDESTSISPRFALFHPGVDALPLQVWLRNGQMDCRLTLPRTLRCWMLECWRSPHHLASESLSSVSQSVQGLRAVCPTCESRGQVATHTHPCCLATQPAAFTYCCCSCQTTKRRC